MSSQAIHVFVYEGRHGIKEKLGIPSLHSTLNTYIETCTLDDASGE